MQARYYDPVIGRFYSNDPVDTLGHMDLGNPIQGFNRYAYANNNPYKYVDPDGRFISRIIMGLATIWESSEIVEAFNDLANDTNKRIDETLEINEITMDDIKRDSSSGSKYAEKLGKSNASMDEMLDSVKENGGKIVEAIPGTTMNGTGERKDKNMEKENEQYHKEKE